MAKRHIIFKTSDGRELTLPVTPKSYTVGTAMSMQTVDVYEAGEYVIPTYQTLQTIKLPDILLPAHDYPFADMSLSAAEWVAWFETQIARKSKLRFIVSGTAVNVPVYVKSIDYGEQDGTGDIYATIELREYRTLSAPELQAAASPSTASRESTAQQTAETTYTVVYGDTLWLIARKFYGDGSLCYKLAAYNGIANANLITVGQVIRIPSAGALGSTAATQSFASAASSGSSSAASSARTYTLTVTSEGKPKNFGFVTVWTPQDASKWTLRGSSGVVKLPQGTTFRLSIDENGHKAAKILLDGADRTGLLSYSVGLVRSNHTLAITWEA